MATTRKGKKVENKVISINQNQPLSISDATISLTNRQLINNLIEEMDDMELVFVRERMVAIAEFVLANEPQVRQTMSNETHHAETYLNAMRKIKEKIGYQN